MRNEQRRWSSDERRIHPEETKMTPASGPAENQSWPTRGFCCVRGPLRLALLCMTLLAWIWGFGLLYFMPFVPEFMGMTFGIGFLLGTVFSLVCFSDVYRTCLWILLFIVCLTVGWLFVSPSNERAWVKDQSVLSTALINNTSISFSNIQRVLLDSAGEISEVRYFDKTYQLKDLERIWFGVECFSQLESLAHTFLTFEFTGEEDDRYLTFSIEIRREIGETFHPLPGIFNNYELVYVLSEEREMITNRLTRTNDRFFLYPIRANAESRSAMLVDMAKRMNHLCSKPEFYNTITNNCTNNIVRHLNRISGRLVSPYRPGVMLPGYSDRVAYDSGLIDTDLSFGEMKEKYRIDLQGHELLDAKNFSSAIRRKFQEQ